jgi:RNA polymerase sigma factor (sigma-70 family)
MAKHSVMVGLLDQCMIYAQTLLDELPTNFLFFGHPQIFTGFCRFPESKPRQNSYHWIKTASPTAMIRLLPEPQQEVVQLTFFKGMSQREIAAQKSIALGTVKTRLQLARKKLLNRLMPIQNKI